MSTASVTRSRVVPGWSMAPVVEAYQAVLDHVEKGRDGLHDEALLRQVFRAAEVLHIELHAARDPQLRKKAFFDPKDWDHKLNYQTVDGEHDTSARLQRSANPGAIRCMPTSVRRPQPAGRRATCMWVDRGANCLPWLRA